MTMLHNRVRNEILKDHKQNDYMQAYAMPLNDRYDLHKEARTELKQVAKQLTDDEHFPYEVVCTIHKDEYFTNAVKMYYVPVGTLEDYKRVSL